MPQHDPVIDNDDGLAVRLDLNQALQALGTLMLGGIAPSPTYPCQLWADSSAGLLKMRNQANSAWIAIGKLDSFGLGGMPSGGAAGALLAKRTGGDFDTQWISPPPLPSGFNVTNGTILDATAHFGRTVIPTGGGNITITMPPVSQGWYCYVAGINAVSSVTFVPNAANPATQFHSRANLLSLLKCGGGDRGKLTVLDGSNFYWQGLRSFQSAQAALPLSATSNFNHGLGVNPGRHILYLSCTVANFGYSVGQLIELPLLGVQDSAGNSRGVNVIPGPNASTLVFGQQLLIMRLDTFAPGLADATKWQFIVRGEVDN